MDSKKDGIERNCTICTNKICSYAGMVNTHIPTCSKYITWPLDGERTAWEAETCGSCDEYGFIGVEGLNEAEGCRQRDGHRGKAVQAHILAIACCNWRPRVTLASYQQDIQRTAREDLSDIDRLTEAAIGAASEAGEIAGLIKKHRYQGHDLDRRKIIEESGDALYYIARGLQEIGSSVEVAMQVNVLKRLELYPKGFDPERSKGRA